ncbi:DUF6924 domain-containing protein [Paenarthrobacter nicotinovorans]|uniref:DUF6924 domain-containing protein n=1 Tax=Paenarthrobacter nicotinovorans TaxID=29320 RepID=UPI003A7FC3CE
MSTLPSIKDSLLVRTTFCDTDAWVDALSVVLTENEDGFRAYVEVVDDNVWDNAGWEHVRDTVLLTSSAQQSSLSWTKPPWDLITRSWW